jgi:Ser/Thr protein kinase RdoA (MazF antagonist)
LKDFFALTRRGKVQRLRKAMWKALAHYDIQPTGLKLLGTDTNIMMRVNTESGTPYVLRLAIPGWRTELDNLSEMIWLDALKETDIGAPIPYATKEGKWLVYETAEGLPCEYRMCLQSWVYGKPLEAHLTPENLFRMGQLFARIHNFSATFTPPDVFSTRKMAHYLSRDEQYALFDEKNRDAHPKVDWAFIDTVDEKVMAAFKRRYADPDGLRVIHNDLWHGNLHIYRGKLLPFDFEDTLWGYPVQDIAMAIHDLDDDGPRDQFEPLFAQFKAGYTSLAAWPERYEDEMNHFRAGRMLWVANWVLEHQSVYFEQHLQAIKPILKRFLAEGVVRFPVEQD